MGLTPWQSTGDLARCEVVEPYLIRVGKSPTGRAPDRAKKPESLAAVSKKQKRGGESFLSGRRALAVLARSKIPTVELPARQGKSEYSPGSAFDLAGGSVGRSEPRPMLANGARQTAYVTCHSPCEGTMPG